VRCVGVFDGHEAHAFVEACCVRVFSAEAHAAEVLTGVFDEGRDQCSADSFIAPCRSDIVRTGDDKVPQSGRWLALDLFCDALDGVMGGEDGSFLPGNEVREIVAGEVGLALGLFKLFVGRGAAGDEVVREAAE
jgi:hypothetical protein